MVVFGDGILKALPWQLPLAGVGGWPEATALAKPHVQKLWHLAHLSSPCWLLKGDVWEAVIESSGSLQRVLEDKRAST